MTGDDGELRARIRTYYRTVGRYIDREHVDDESRRFWTEAAREADPTPVLELGCGTGRVTLALLAGAGSVLGLDLAPEMLERARARLAGRPGVHLIRADMRRVPSGGPFGLVTAAADPFAHLLSDEDRLGALREAARVLASDGRLVLEAHWLGPDRLAGARRPGGIERVRELASGGGDLRVRESWRCEAETRRCRARYEYLRGERVVDRASCEARLWGLDELRETTAKAGLRVRSLWGTFGRAPFDPETSPRLLVEAVPDPDRPPPASDPEITKRHRP